MLCSGHSKVYQLMRNRVAIFLAFTVYCMAARTVWRKRKELPGFLNPLNEDPFKNTITREIEIEVVSEPRANVSPTTTRVDEEIPGAGPISSEENYDRYLVDVKADPQSGNRRPSMPTELQRIRTLTRTAATNEMNGDAWLYARTSFLFFLALLIVWVSPPMALAAPPTNNVCRSHQVSIVSTRSRIRRRFVSGSTMSLRWSFPCRASSTRLSTSSPRRRLASGSGVTFGAGMRHQDMRMSWTAWAAMGRTTSSSIA